MEWAYFGGSGVMVGTYWWWCNGVSILVVVVYWCGHIGGGGVIVWAYWWWYGCIGVILLVVVV